MKGRIMDNETLGIYIARARKAKGLTQKELAERLHVTDKAVSKWETGRGYPDIKVLPVLAAELGISLAELLQAQEPAPSASVHSRETIGTKTASSPAIRARSSQFLQWLFLIAGSIGLAAGIYCLIRYMQWNSLGIIGGSDASTDILIVDSSPRLPWQWSLLIFISLLCLFAGIALWLFRRKQISRRNKK